MYLQVSPSVMKPNCANCGKVKWMYKLELEHWSLVEAVTQHSWAFHVIGCLFWAENGG